MSKMTLEQFNTLAILAQENGDRRLAVNHREYYELDLGAFWCRFYPHPSDDQRDELNVHFDYPYYSMRRQMTKIYFRDGLPDCREITQ